MAFPDLCKSEFTITTLRAASSCGSQSCAGDVTCNNPSAKIFMVEGAA